MTKSAPLFRTLVDVIPFPKLIQVSHSQVFLGSCFAQNIGGKFAEYGLDATTNPLGTLYNPQSVTTVVRHALQSDPEPLPIYDDENDIYRCWLAGMQVGEPTEEACRRHMTTLLSGLASDLRRASHVFVTLGTNVCYRHCTLNMVVSNCHHAHKDTFAEERMSVEQCVACLLQMVEMLREANPDVQVIFTVSPFRYAKYGFHGSQLSKATLLLAVDEVCRRADCCRYFPSYEIVTDELRDYRFYEADMIHPSAQAVDYIWQRLVEECFSTSAQQYLKEYEPIRRGLLHRPSNPEGEAHTCFLQELTKRRDELRAKYVR